MKSALNYRASNYRFAPGDAVLEFNHFNFPSACCFNSKAPWPISKEGSSAVPKFLSNFSDAVKTVSYHPYSLSPAHGPVSTERLLANTSTVEHARVCAPLIAAARQAGVDFVIGGGNTVARGGTPNISDVFVSALWALDWLPEISKQGAVGQNFMVQELMDC